jgi:hypothetical protein
MDGLEASEVKFSYVMSNNDVFRFDSEFFWKEYLDLENKVMKYPILDEAAERVLCGPFGSTILEETYQESGVLVVRPFNIKNIRIENDNHVYISKQDVLEKDLKLFREGTLMFARVGDVRCGVLTFEEVTISPNIIALELAENSGYSPYFLATFFNTHYGLMQIQREVKVVAQPTISTDTVRTLKAPKLDRNFQERIESVVKSGFTKEGEASKIYKSAEQLLLQHLGLAN